MPFPNVYINEFGGGNGHVDNFNLLMKNAWAFDEKVCHYLIQSKFSFQPHHRSVKFERIEVPERSSLDYLTAENYSINYADALFRREFGPHSVNRNQALIIAYLKMFRGVYQELKAEGKKNMVVYFDYAPFAQLAFWIFKNSFAEEHDPGMTFEGFGFGSPFCNPSPTIVNYDDLLYPRVAKTKGECVRNSFDLYSKFVDLLRGLRTRVAFETDILGKFGSPYTSSTIPCFELDYWFILTGVTSRGDAEKLDCYGAFRDSEKVSYINQGIKSDPIYPPLNIIVSAGKNGVITQGVKMPWDLPEELAHFKSLTKGNAVIIGRKTWESLSKESRPFPDCHNIVLSQNSSYVAEGADVATSLEEAFSFVLPSEEIFVIGGNSLYFQTSMMAKRVYFVEVDNVPEGEEVLSLNKDHWKKVAKENYTGEDQLNYSFTTYETTLNHIVLYGYITPDRLTDLAELLILEPDIHGYVVVKGVSPEVKEYAAMFADRCVITSEMLSPKEEARMLEGADILFFQPSAGVLSKAVQLDAFLIMTEPQYLEQAINADRYYKHYKRNNRPVYSAAHEREPFVFCNTEPLLEFIKQRKAKKGITA
jgi:dihydrofolate reductase